MNLLFFLCLLHGRVERLGNVVGLGPVDLASTILAAREPKEIETVGNDTTTEGEREREREGKGGRGRERRLKMAMGCYFSINSLKWIGSIKLLKMLVAMSVSHLIRCHSLAYHLVQIIT